MIAIDPNAPAVEIPNEMRDGGFQVNCWAPNSNSLILSKDTPQRKHYYGEKHWQLDTDKWELNIETNASKQLAVSSRYDVWDISPDGHLLALNWDTHAHLTGAQLYIANREGSSLRPLAQKREQYYWYPRFSPDGTSVLSKYLNAQRGGNKPEGPVISIRVIAIDGSSERSIQVSDEYMPEIACWSPDGDQIAVVAFQNAAFAGASKESKIFVVDADGTQIADVKLRNATGIFSGDIDWSSLNLVPE